MRLSLHSSPSRPPVRERPTHITVCRSTYCRLSSTSLLFGLLAPTGRMRISARWYSFFTEVQNFSRFKLILVEIATTRLTQRRVISYRLLQGRFNRFLEWSVKKWIIIAVSAFLYLTYILYHIFL